jgi:hypothetical protein
MVDERRGWFVVNVRDARWYRNAAPDLADRLSPVLN